MQQNIDIFNFELTAADMEAISEMDEGRSEIMDFYAPAQSIC
jgi:diketogulonate reductase-like aldo/keto reductase